MVISTSDVHMIVSRSKPSRKARECMYIYILYIYMLYGISLYISSHLGTDWLMVTFPTHSWGECMASHAQSLESLAVKHLDVLLVVSYI